MADLKKSYWNRNGKYQKEFNRFDKMGLMPASGNASTLEGELLRCANNLYYDLYNNGCCNNKSGFWNFLVTNNHLLKIKVEVLSEVKDYACGKRALFSDKKLFQDYEVIFDKVLMFINKQEKKAQKLAQKNKEKLSLKHFTPNSEDALNYELMSYEDSVESLENDFWQDDEENELNLEDKY